jgi:predicted flap endonuclease-1-like 5' DNA nuclease
LRDHIVNIEDVEGIGPVHAASLRAAGVATTDALLERGATARGRADLADITGVTPTLILEWVNHVDLMRIDGVGSEYSDLLEAAGVDSPAELAQRNAANLAQTFLELDAARPDWIRSVPSVTTVEDWIAQAKALPKIVTHGGGGGGDDEMAPAAAAAEVAAAAPVATEAAPEATTPPAEPVAVAAPTSPAAETAPKSESLWGRIKRAFGG